LERGAERAAALAAGRELEDEDEEQHAMRRKQTTNNDATLFCALKNDNAPASVASVREHTTHDMDGNLNKPYIQIQALLSCKQTSIIMTIVSLPDIAELRVHTARPDAPHGTRPSDLRVSHTD